MDEGMIGNDFYYPIYFMINESCIQVEKINKNSMKRRLRKNETE